MYPRRSLNLYNLISLPQKCWSYSISHDIRSVRCCRGRGGWCHTWDLMRVGHAPCQLSYTPSFSFLRLVYKFTGFLEASSQMFASISFSPSSFLLPGGSLSFCSLYTHSLLHFLFSIAVKISSFLLMILIRMRFAL